MSSCGSPSVEKDALMPRKQKFDKTKTCIKCKEANGNIVIRHAIYCKTCFFPLITIKFRRRFEPHVNENSTEPPRKGRLKASGNLALGFSGGLGSTVLLDLIHQCYFSRKDHDILDDLKGGRSHPRNDRVWKKAFVCYVDICGAFSEGTIKERTENIRSVAEGYGFEFVLIRIEQVFNDEWWRMVSDTSNLDDIRVDMTNEDLDTTTIPSLSPHSATAALQSYLAALPTPTAVRTSINNLVRLLLVHTARHLGSSHLALGTSLTSLSISLITSIAHGGGFNMQEESYEEIPEPITRLNVNDVVKDRPRSLRVVRPLQDIGMKECAAWAWWRNLRIVGRESIPGVGGKTAIGGLTTDFIVGLERDYPSTVSTIARTCAKVTPKYEADGRCILCSRPFKQGVLEWKSRISIRTLSDESLLDEKSNKQPPLYSPLSLSRHLCYACHTTLTSRSSRSAKPNGKDVRVYDVPLPVWVKASLKTTHQPEIWQSKQIERSEMKQSISEFLLDD